MALLKIIDSKQVTRRHVDVPVSEGVEVRLQSMTVEGQLRLAKLNKRINQISAEKGYTAEQVGVLGIVASLMCQMVDDEGVFLAPDDEQIEAVRDWLDINGYFFTLMSAMNELNGLKLDAENLEDAKKNS